VTDLPASDRLAGQHGPLGQSDPGRADDTACRSLTGLRPDGVAVATAPCSITGWIWWRYLLVTGVPLWPTGREMSSMRTPDRRPAPAAPRSRRGRASAAGTPGLGVRPGSPPPARSRGVSPCGPGRGGPWARTPRSRRASMIAAITCGPVRLPRPATPPAARRPARSAPRSPCPARRAGSYRTHPCRLENARRLILLVANHRVLRSSPP
jgi:hypothetical protein